MLDSAQQLIHEAYAVRKNGDDQRALQLFQAAADELRMLGEPLRLAHTVRHVADLQRRRNLLDAAHKNYAEALSIYRGQASTSKLDLANALRGYALLMEEINDASAAREMWLEARDLYRAVDVQAGVEEAQHRLNFLAESGDPD